MATLNYNHLRYFHAVAHDGNLTRTAARMNVSQSALSVQIKKLEERLGYPLFERRGRSLELTEAGRIALDHADAIFSRGDDLVSELAQSGRARQAIRVGAAATLSRNFQIGFLTPLIGRPDVDVILRSGGPAELIAALDNLALDIVLTNQPPPRDAVTHRISYKLSEETVSLVGRRERIAKGSEIRDLISSQPLILPGPESSIRTGFDAFISREELRPEIAAEVDDMAMMRLLVRRDAGLAVLPPIVVQDELRSGVIVDAGALPGINETFYAVTLDRRFPNPLVGTLINAPSNPSAE
jgi:LysR family transcriptional activator of nhaA